MSAKPLLVVGLFALAGIGFFVASKKTGMQTPAWKYDHQTYEALPGEWAYTVTLNGLFVHSSEQTEDVYATKALADDAARSYIAGLGGPKK